MTKAQSRRIWCISFSITLLALVLRIYHLNQLYIFGADEEYQTNIVMTLVRNFHLIWIGVSAANTGFYLGPFWSYFTYIWLLLFHGDPLSTAYIAAFLGAFTTFVVFYVGWKMFSFRAGVIASILHACLPLIVFFDQKYWNPSATPLLSVVMLYSLYRTRDNQRFWLLFALSFGLVFHTHLSLVPFALLALYQIRNGINKTILIQSIIVFLLVLSPLIVFDYFHNWSNITTPLRLGQIALSANESYLAKFKALTESVMRVWYLPQFSINANEVLSACSKYRSSPSILAFPFLILIIIFFIRKQTWLQENSRVLLFSIILISLSFILFPGRKDEYYLLGLFPLLLFIPALLWNKHLIPVLILAISVLGITGIVTSYNPYGLEAKKQIISKVMSIIGTNPYDLEEQGVCHQYEGWRYLFTTYARPPERSSIDSTFGWLYPDQIHKTYVKYSVIIRGYDSGNRSFTYQIIGHP